MDRLLVRMGERMIELDLNNRSMKELKILKEQVMRSELDFNNKNYLINKIESKMGIKHSREDILAIIKESEADIDDINE